MRSNRDDFTNHPVENLVLFFCKMSICVLTEFLGYQSEYKSESGTKLKLVEETILTFARLDPLTATVLTCLCSDGTDKVEGHC